VKFSSFATVINAALQITASFKTLHNKGLSYQDLNDGNFFINPETGDVLIGDNDNVAHDGENLGIQGKPRYVAPEVVLSQHKPDTFSDRFSLAVILFLLLFRNHPLAGERDQDGDDPDENELNLYCKNPVFIFDPEDDSNRPKAGIHVNALKFWPVFPSYIHELFQRAFHKELMRRDGANREDRIIEREWLKALVRLRRDLFFCANCGNLTFYPKEGEQIVCMNCNKPAEQPAFLVIGSQRIPLQPGLSIYRYDIDTTSDFTVENIREEIGLVVQNQKDSRIWGLKNLSDLPWYRRSPGGKEEVRMTGEVIPVIRNNSIKFGTLSEGTIK
jgi:DNA-binding helix-hairpin-helix protein with protein kinase domain